LLVSEKGVIGAKTELKHDAKQVESLVKLVVTVRLEAASFEARAEQPRTELCKALDNQGKLTTLLQKGAKDTFKSDHLANAYEDGETYTDLCAEPLRYFYRGACFWH
jgi:hypothetical protein